MTTLTVTAKGQVTLKKELLKHLGVEPGGKIAVDALPGGRLSVRSVEGNGSIEDFIGHLAGKSDRIATIEDMNEAIADGWAGKR